MSSPGVSPPPEHVVDLLWSRYRSLADQTMKDAPCTDGACTPQSAKGIMSLFVANCITRWVDRIEREPDAHRRKEMINLLLGV
jgi:hypothetical protein